RQAGLDVPLATLRGAVKYLDSCCLHGEEGDEGYGYVSVGATPTMSAVGLLCREHLQDWRLKNPRLAAGIKNHIEPNPFNHRNMYYSYYATQVVYHAGGTAWKTWN